MLSLWPSNDQISSAIWGAKDDNSIFNGSRIAPLVTSQLGQVIHADHEVGDRGIERKAFNILPGFKNGFMQDFEFFSGR